MLKIRLQRVGRKHDPSFRIVLTDRRNATKSGKFLEVLGSYNARAGSLAMKADRIKYWIGVGSQPSDTVHNLLISEKVVEGKKINVLPKKSPVKKEEKVEEKPAGEVKEESEAAPEVKAETAPEKVEEVTEKGEEASTEQKEEKMEDKPTEVETKQEEKPEE